MDDQRVGAALRAVRIRRGWRQSDVASAAGVSASMVSLLERGHLERVALRTIRGVAAVLEVRLDMVARWRGGELDRLLNAGHAAMHQEVARHLDTLAGWVHAAEISFSIYGERGVIDVLAFHPPTGSLLVVELKTELVSIEDLLTTMDRRLRLAPKIARERGWNAASVSGWVLVADGRPNRSRAAEHAATLRSVLPAGGREVGSWLRSPSGPIRALSFLANSNRGGLNRQLAPRKRVRRRSVAARPA